jgi:flagellin
VGLQRGTQNAQYGLAAARIADDALGRIYDILVKIKDKIVEAANAHTDEERYQAQQQINEYVRNIAQIVNQTEFDGRYLLNGDSFEVHFGSHKDQYLVINGSKAGAKGLAILASASSQVSDGAKLNLLIGGSATDKIYGVDKLGGNYELQLLSAAVSNGLTIKVAVKSSQLSDIEQSLDNVETFMTAIDRLRGYYAGIENKLQNIIENNQVMIDNMKEGESLVRNVDYASAMAEFQKMRVVTQANVAALAQANQIPQLVQQLLR